MIALQLIRKASYSGEDAERERRRQVAYRLAHDLIGQIGKTSIRNPPLRSEAVLKDGTRAVSSNGAPWAAVAGAGA